MVTRNQIRRIELLKGILDHRTRRFDRQALPPINPSQMKAEFVHVWLGGVRPQSTAAHVRVVGQQEHGPVLNAVGRLAGDFLREPPLNLLW